MTQNLPEKATTTSSQIVGIDIKYLYRKTLNIALVILSVVLVILLARELYILLNLTLKINASTDAQEGILTGILTFFLYFEFLAMILKYFEEDYHFPLRYFMYIGITATIRLIVVDHDDAGQTLLFAWTILVLVISYAIITLLTILKKKLNITDR